MPAASDALEFKALNARQHKKLAALLAAGGNPNQVDHKGHSLLYLACQSEQPRAVDALLHAGANPNVWTGQGQQPLHEAMRHNDVGLVRTLLDAGADPTVVRQTTQVWSSAVYQGAIVGALPCLDLLAERFGDRLDGNLGTHDGTTPLIGAVRNDQPDVAAWLIRHGATLDAPAGKQGATALLQACSRGLPAMVPVLLDAGANPNAVDGNGWTALHHLAQIDEAGVMPLGHALIAAGADVLALNARQETPAAQFVRVPSHRNTPLAHWWQAQEEKAQLRQVVTASMPTTLPDADPSTRPRARL